ncbi:hypothetical protein BGP77_00090 [Saccharospirillum sp. MSK14-1]|uniref:transporter substrate-binding domain-containing protein n=1 Tax=Saccharospirillum sp. MSK14-1 TaxID=1897632 RepID=UPI000D35798E|nr:transporter substrate-binding domain-containing protein [Saccharospirillum sp. MSK14-1]PTY35768.1 hypothetical protein BGP77_00090 [Saccharospirillum sp. MSK14-1]
MKVLFRTGCWLCLLLSPLTKAESDQAIIWAATDLPGVYRLNTDATPAQLEGFIGDLQNYLFAHLADTFQLEPVAMLIPRIERELRARDNVCTGILLRTAEREQYLHFSLPYMVIPTPQIVMSSTGWAKLGQPERHSLEDLVNNPALVGLRVNHRAYGRLIDQYLDSATGPIINVTGSANAMRMLAGGRADYLIEYPMVISELLGEQADTLRFVTITHSPPFMNLAISCSQSEQGAAFIAAVNAQLPTLVRDPVYKALNLDAAPRQLQADLDDIYLQQVISVQR